MLEQIQQWPSPITTENYKSLEFDELLKFGLSNSNDSPVRLYKITKNIQTALTEDNVKSLDPLISLNFTELEQIWIRFLEALRQGVVNDQNQILSSNVFVDGSWNTVNINYDAGSDKFTIQDSYLFNDWAKQKDFGLLYRLGQLLNDEIVSTKGGARSLATKAALNSVKSKGELYEKLLDKKQENFNKEAQEKMESLSGVSAAAEWGDEYLKRIWRLEEDTYGRRRTKGELVNQVTQEDSGKVSRVLRFITSSQTIYWVYLVFLVFVVFTTLSSIGIDRINDIITKFTSLDIKGLLEAVRTNGGSLLFLALLYIGFKKVSEDHKVKQNSLENYQHRYATAKALNLIMRGHNDLLDSNDKRVMLTHAASALFDMQPSGYFKNQDINNPSPIEIFKDASRSDK